MRFAWFFLLALAAPLLGCSDPLPPPPVHVPADLTAVPTAAAACVGEGELPPPGDPRKPIEACCEGLAPVQVYKASTFRLDTCLANEEVGYTCAKCGDGRCGKGESACACPLDCKP